MASYLFSTTDPLGRNVELTDTCYASHIIFEHPDMDDIDEIEQTIRRPEYITQDVIDSHRRIYYRTYRRRPQRWLIKVVVEGREVVTAYRVKRLKQGENIVWPR